MFKSTPPATPAGEVIPELGTPRVQRRELDDRPVINLVARVGDPAFAIAFAAAHDFGSQASVALSSLIVARLQKAGTSGVASEPHELGFQVFALVRNESEAKQLISRLAAAVAEPVADAEPGLALAAQNLSKLRARSYLGPADASVGQCSGEAAMLPGAPLVDVTTPAGRAELEKWRRAIHSVKSAAFAALGPPNVLDTAADALADSPAWSSSESSNDRWPERDNIGSDIADAQRRLSVGFRVPSADAAVAAARLLGSPESDLDVRLSAFSNGWRLERTSATARPRGACLRVDALAPAGDPGPSAQEAARAAAMLVEEAERALSRVGRARGALDENITRPSDPRQAVSAAAWRALVERLPAGSTRRFMSLSVRPGERAVAAEFGKAFEQLEAQWQKPVLETRVRAEPGQGEFWVLVANACGTASEGSADAGFLAIAARALAARHTLANDVALEPWVTPDGVGILAHAPRRDPDESPQAQADRVVTALARALIGRRLAGSELISARDSLLEELGPGPRPAFWQALEGVAPEHPSWLEPRGTWSAIAEVGADSLESRQRALLAGPLRVAVIASSNADQAKSAAGTLERWLRPLQREGQRCPASRIGPPRTGVFSIETSTADDATFVAVQLPARASAPSPEAEITLILLNRRNGWLEQALTRAGISASAQARVLGGSRAQALIVEIRAEPAAERDAVAQVRGLLDRLSRGAATAADLNFGQQERERLAAMAALDPRRRIVDLWRGNAASAPVDLAALRAFHATLRPEAQVVVQVSPKQ